MVSFDRGGSGASKFLAMSELMSERKYGEPVIKGVLVYIAIGVQ